MNDKRENIYETWNAFPKLINNSLKALKYHCFFLQNRQFVLLRSRFDSIYLYLSINNHVKRKQLTFYYASKITLLSFHVECFLFVQFIKYFCYEIGHDLNGHNSNFSVTGNVFKTCNVSKTTFFHRNSFKKTQGSFLRIISKESGVRAMLTSA